MKIPEDIYAKYDLIVKQCETCQKEKRGPSRSKISGMRSEIFGDLTFVDHSEIPLDNKYKLMFLIIYDGATQLMTSLPCETKPESETIDLLMDCFDLYQLSPKYIIAKRSSDTTEEASSSTGKKVKVELPTPPAAPTGTARHVNKIPVCAATNSNSTGSYTTTTICQIQNTSSSFTSTVAVAIFLLVRHRQREKEENPIQRIVVNHCRDNGNSISMMRRFICRNLNWSTMQELTWMNTPM